MHSASWSGHLDVVEYLINKGADINAKDKDGKTPLDLATQKGYNNIVEILRQAQSNLDKGLLTAVYGGDLNKVKDLIAHGASLEAKGDNDNTPLQLAAWIGHLDIVKFLVKKEANLNTKDKDGNTPLQLAAWVNHLDIVKFLVKKGADLNTKDKSGNTPLQFAAQIGHLDIVKFLVKKGADLNAKDKNGNTPLQLAAWAGHLDVITFLVEEGADFKKADERGRALLYWASFYGGLDLVKYLVDKGADINAEDTEGKTPLDIARDKGHNNVVNYLEEELNKERPAQRKRHHHHGDHARHHMSRKPLAIDSSNQPEIATSSAIKLSSWINDLFDWVKGSVGGLLSSKPILSKETSSTSSPISQVDAKMDVNGTIMLLDVVVRKVTGQKYVSTVDQPISSLKVQGYALNITNRFEKVVEQAGLKSGVSMHRLNIDYMGMQKEITRKVMSGKFNEISGILKSYVEKACPGEEAGKLSPKKFEKFIAQFNKGLLNQSIEQILHNRDGRLEVDDAKQMSLEPQSYLSNASVHSHSEVSTCLSEIGVTKLGGNINR